MGLSRKRQRELNRLKRSAEDLWDEQRETLEHAVDVLRDARRQASNYAREEVAPRVKPVLASGLAAGRSAVTATRGRLADDVIPAVSGAIGSALAVLEAAKDPRVREVVRSASRTTAQLGRRASRAVAPPPPPKSGPGPGTFILIGLGVLAAASVAYAAWQTLRADDDLWIEDAGAGEADVDDAS